MAGFERDVRKHADDTATVKQADNYGPLGRLVGTSLGSVIGLLGGPAGGAIGAAEPGIPRSTLESRIRSLRIDKNRFRSSR